MIDSTLPLTDIHRHLDGNIRAQTILDLGRQFNISLPANTLDTLRPHVQVTSNEPDLVSFLSKLDWGVKVLASLEACRRVAYENLEDAARNGLHYVELRFSPRYMAMIHQLPVSRAFSARESILPQEMVSSGRPKPIKLNVDSATMAERMFMTTINRMDEKKFGARWPNSSRKKPPPMHRLATMYPL